MLSACFGPCIAVCTDPWGLQYWDAITKEDLEFSVSQRQNAWDVKDPLLDDDRRGTMYMDSDFASSAMLHSNDRRSAAY